MRLAGTEVVAVDVKQGLREVVQVEWNNLVMDWIKSSTKQGAKDGFLELLGG